MPDTNLHPIFDSILAPVRPIVATPEPVTMETADGYMVISKMHRPSSVKPPYSYQYDAEHWDTLEEAEDNFNDYVNDKHPGWQAVTIVPCRKGVPLGAKRILP